MLLRRFQAPTLQEALRKVEREFGRDALLVETVRTQRGFTVVAAERGSEDSRAVLQPVPPPRARWSKGFAPLAEAAEAFGLGQTVLRAVENALRGTRVQIGRPGDPALPRVAARILASLIPTTGLDRHGARAVALVGATGVGKTTTLAKLAAAYRAAGETVGIVTIDTWRIAAVEQLRAYADLLGAALHVALTPAELRRCVADLHGTDRVLIDTTGRSPFDRRALERLHGTLTSSGAATVLCLPAGCRRSDAEAQLDAWREIDVDAIVLTKWDETRAPGEPLSLAIERGVPLSHVTIGQEVPDDIVPADAAALAAHALGLDQPHVEPVA